MNKSIIAQATVNQPEWATEKEELDAVGTVRWSRTVHEATDGVDVSVSLTQFVDEEGADEPTMRVWVEGNVLDMVGVDETKLTPEWLGRLGLELLVASFRARAILDPEPLVWERDEAGYSDAAVASEVAAPWKHFITSDDAGEIPEVHLAGENLDLSLADARRYILEAARVVAIAEGL